MGIVYNHLKDVIIGNNSQTAKFNKAKALWGTIIVQTTEYEIV